MSLSTLQLFNTIGEIDLYSRLVILSGTTFKLATATNVFWSLCGLDNTTLSPIDDNLQNVDYWFTHKFEEAEYPITNIALVSGNDYYFTLSPYVTSTNAHLGITPIVSGGTSIQFYVSGSTTNYDLTGRHLFISNQGEEFDDNVDSLRYLNSTPPSGILSGIWIKNNLISGNDVWGLIDYSNGHVWLDLKHIGSDVFEANYKTLYAKWEGNFGNNLFNSIVGNNPYLTAANLRMFCKNDIQNYHISVSSNNFDTPYPIAEYNFFPRSIAILENDYNFTTVTLSAVYKERDQYLNLSNNDYLNTVYPFHSVSGRIMCWRSTLSTLSAYLPLSGNHLISLATELSGWSKEIQNIQLTSVNLNTTNYQISARFPDDTLGYRTTAIYTFLYDPIITEDLKVTVLSSNIDTEILQVYRQVTTDSTVSYVNPTYPLVWRLSPMTLSGNVQVCSGLLPAELENHTYYICNNYSSLSGYVGVLSTRELSSSMGILTATDYIYGVDYLQMNYDTNPDLIYTWTVSYSGENPYSGTPTDTHIFQVYSSPVNIAISAISTELEAFTRSITAKVMNDKGGGVYIPLHTANKIIWNIISPDSTAITAVTLQGDTYDYTSYTDDTLIINLQTSYFDLSSNLPTLCTINLFASAYNTYDFPTTYITNTSYDWTVDTFPSNALFDSSLQINQETSKEITDLWRVWSTNYLVTATDVTTIVGTNVLTGSRTFTTGDGRSISVRTSAFPYATSGTYTVNLIRSGVSASGWLSAHKIESNLDIHLLSRFLSGDFLVCPTYVFLTSSLQAINNFTDPLTTYGVSAYDVGHTEPFLLSAFDGVGSTYIWSVGNTTLGTYTSSVIYNHSEITPISGLPIQLKVYNNEMQPDMPLTYKSDDNGAIEYYPNVKITNNSSIYFQHLKMLDYDKPQISIVNATQNLLFPVDRIISASHLLNYSTDLPIIENSSTITWVLSTPNWVINTNLNDFETTITLGSDDTIPGVIKYEANYPIDLYLTVFVNSEIPNTFPPNDWGTNNQILTTVQNIPYLALPELLFVPTTKQNIINNPITFRNLTTPTPYISGFYINDGYHVTNYFVSAFEDFVTSYPINGTYTINITGNIIDRGYYTNTLTNIITILTGYESFDSTVSRIFGATELSLPNNIQTIQIPPNEWVTAYNLNRSISAINDNLTYLKNMTRFYSFPPIAETGWLGTTYSGITSGFRWQDPAFANYIGLSGSVSDNTLHGIRDIKFKNNYLYIVDEIGIKIFDNTYNSQLLNTIVNKTIGDPITMAKSIVINNQNHIYILDKDQNRILVFAEYIDSTNPKSNEFLYMWGGFGSINSKYYFNNPNHLYIDSDDYIWVVDTGNKGLKKYTRTGGWLKTYDLKDYISGTTVETDGLIDMTIDSNLHIHLLTKSCVYKFDLDGDYIGKYTFKNDNNELPQKIITADGKGFIYICLQTSVVKVLENGNYAGFFANTIEAAAFNSIYHNEYKDFYVANTNNILRYFETNVINSNTETSVNPYLWNIVDITVKEDENIEAWVINRILKRLWDNIDLFRRSLTGQITYSTDSYGRPIIQIQNFTPDEYNDMFLTPKEDIFIGINELVSNSTINRCLKQIHESMDRLKNYV